MSQDDSDVATGYGSYSPAGTTVNRTASGEIEDIIVDVDSQQTGGTIRFVFKIHEDKAFISSFDGILNEDILLIGQMTATAEDVVKNMDVADTVTRYMEKVYKYDPHHS